MKLSDDQLKALFRRRTARSARVEAECLTEELLHRPAARELAENDRERVIAHLRSCSDCAREYRIMHSTKEWASQVAPAFSGESAARKEREAPARARPLAALWNRTMLGPAWRAGALAAMLVIMAGASLIAWRAMHPPRTPPTDRAPAGLTIKIDPPDRAQLADVPLRLSWSEVKGAEGYQVALYDSELSPIWDSPQLKATSVEIPESIRARLTKGRPVYWRVFINGGIERRQSDLFQFVLVSK